MNSILQRTSITGAILLFVAWGCVDVDEPNLQTVDFRSQIKVLNLATGVGIAAVTIDGTTFGSADFGFEFPASGDAYRDMPAGSRELRVSFSGGAGDTARIVFETDRKGRVLILGDQTARRYVFSGERYVFETVTIPTDTGQIRLLNASPDAGDIEVVAMGADTTTLTSALAFAAGTGYLKIAAGSYNITAVDGTDTLVNAAAITISAGSRYTYAVYDSTASAVGDLYVDD